MARLFVTLQYLLPHHLLCRLVYVLSRSPRVWLKNSLIRAFVRHYRPCMGEALESEPLRYPTFNAFFTRALKPRARPLDPAAGRLLCPCDAILSQAAALQEDQLLQAKAHRYSLQALLAAEPQWCARLRGGSYATLYLAPYHYHRVHMPLEGTLRAAWHVPGRLFSVNAATVARVPGLFARNERLVCAFDSERGPFALVLIGALFVGSLSTLWHGEVTPWRREGTSARGVRRLEPVNAAELRQPRGAEFARFNMGSTVVLLLAPGLARWDAELILGAEVRVGQGLGSLGGG